MSKRFIDRVIEFLSVIYNNQEPTVKIPKVDKMVRDEKFKNVIYYLVMNKYIKITYKNEKSQDVSSQNIGHIHLTDSGVEYLTSYRDRKAQKEFNRMIAFTGAIIALIAIYDFLSKLGLIKSFNFITVIFVIIFIGALAPIIAFIINSYFGRN